MTKDATQQDVVRRGYDELSELYRGDEATPDIRRRYDPLLGQLFTLLPDAQNLSFLDLGCGCGIPICQDLVGKGHSVTGVDISGKQVERARSIVSDPRASFRQADICDLANASESSSSRASSTLEWVPSDGAYHGIISLWTFIHLPIDEQPKALRAVRRWLRDDGVALLVVGKEELPLAEKAGWLDAPEHVKMRWSHPHIDKFREWVGEAGLTIESEMFIPDAYAAPKDGTQEKQSGHQMLLLKKGSNSH